MSEEMPKYETRASVNGDDRYRCASCHLITQENEPYCHHCRDAAMGLKMPAWPMTEEEAVDPYGYEATAKMYRDTHIPYTGKPYRPDYYKPQRRNPRIDPSADVSDVLHAWAIDSHPIGEAIAKLLRCGKKPGESRIKDLNKVMEHIHREIEFAEMEQEGE